MVEKTFSRLAGTHVQCVCGKAFFGDDDHGPIFYALEHRQFLEHARLKLQRWVPRE